MPEGWIRIPDRVLPAPSRGDLPAPWPLRRMLGPSVILAGLSIGSGELVLWPRLTLEFGFTLFWACWIGVTAPGRHRTWPVASSGTGTCQTRPRSSAGGARRFRIR